MGNFSEPSESHILKICGIVVAYYPEFEEFWHNIEQYINDIDHLIIWDNTPSSNSKNSTIEPPKHLKNKITILGTGKNEYISLPLNSGIKWARERRFTHILTMDQDSQWINFKKFIEEVSVNPKYKIFAPNVNNALDGKGNFEKEYSITSGTLYSLDIFDIVGYFNEAYQIDGVDIEFGLRGYIKGIPTLMLTKAHLKQKFGDTQTRKLFKITNYSPTRRYYIMRNDIWLLRQYKKYLPKSKKRYIKKEYLINLLMIIIYESNKFEKIKSLTKGLFHGIFK